MVSSPGSQTMTSSRRVSSVRTPAKRKSCSSCREIARLIGFPPYRLRDGAAVLPAVARVDDHGLNAAPLPHRPSGREGPSGACRKMRKVRSYRPPAMYTAAFVSESAGSCQSPRPSLCAAAYPICHYSDFLSGKQVPYLPLPHRIGYAPKGAFNKEGITKLWKNPK